NTTRPVPMEMLSGACFMLPRSIIEQMGAFFDEGFPLYYEDTDLFRRIRLLGKKLVFVPEAEIVHFYNRSGTTNQEEAWRRYWKARSYYYRKWYGPAGSLLEAVSRRFLNTRVASHSRSDMERRVIDLGDVWEPPRLEFGRFLESCLIEICQDAAFLLAAGMLWSGSHWDPGSLFWRAFGESEYFLRIVDLSAGHPIEVKVYRFRRVPAPGAAPISTDETAPPDGEDREFGRVPLQA
ncbi:MAG: glycosyltransferase family 2 protein, partial [Planctomycetota bacterium]